MRKGAISICKWVMLFFFLAVSVTVLQGRETVLAAPTQQDGWVEEDGKSYYYKDGEALTGFQTIDGKKYYFNIVHGYKETGWYITSAGGRYYFGTDGVVKSGWVTVDGKNYLLNTNGKAYTNWFTTSAGNKYYFGSDGVSVRSQWKTISGKKYYFTENGRAAKD